MAKKVIILTFELESVSYQAFSEIKKMHMKREIKGEQMAVVTHREDGTHKFDIQDFIDFTGNNNSAKGSTIGMLIGLFGGFLPMMLGWFAGSMIGGAKDAKEITEAKSIFESVADQIGEGQTGAVLIAEEADNRPLNDLVFNRLGGQITRLDFDEVEEEISSAQKMEDEAKKNKDKSESGTQTETN